MLPALLLSGSGAKKPRMAPCRAPCPVIGEAGGAASLRLWLCGLVLVVVFAGPVQSVQAADLLPDSSSLSPVKGEAVRARVAASPAGSMTGNRQRASRYAVQAGSEVDGNPDARSLSGGGWQTFEMPDFGSVGFDESCPER